MGIQRPKFKINDEIIVNNELYIVVGVKYGANSWLYNVAGLAPNPIHEINLVKFIEREQSK